VVFFHINASEIDIVDRIHKKFYRPAAPIRFWGVVVFETERRLERSTVNEVVAGLMASCGDVGKRCNIVLLKLF